MKHINSNYFIGLLLIFSVTSVFARPPVKVIAYQVEQVSSPQIVSLLGHLQAEQSVSLVSSATDRVQKIHFSDGEKVLKNQLLLELNIDEELALLEEIKVSVAESKRQYFRVKNIEGRGSVTAALIDEKYREWQKNIAKQKVIEAQIEDRKIVAPFNGVMGLSSISEGALVQASSHLVTIDNNQLMKMNLLIPMQYLPFLQPNLMVSVKTIAYPKKRFNGTVTAISPRLDQATRLVQVSVVIENPENLLMTNMMVHAEINLPDRVYLTIPNSAILMLGDDQFVYRLTEKEMGIYQAEKVAIKMGKISSATTEVISGLNKKDLIVSQGIMRVKNQSLIQIKALQNNQSQEALLKAVSTPSKQVN